MARLFLDYEPGIYYTQFQMQAGVTGINLLEYITQSNNQKKKILMVLLLKKWLPELSNFDVPFIHEPWKLTAFDLIDKTIPLFYKNPIISVDLKMN